MVVPRVIVPYVAAAQKTPTQEGFIVEFYDEVRVESQIFQVLQSRQRSRRNAVQEVLLRMRKKKEFQLLEDSSRTTRLTFRVMFYKQSII